jgi:hypothetical protein
MADKIYHEWCKDNEVALCKKIDDVYNGLPARANSLVMTHTDSREGYFAAAYPHDAWNMVVLNPDTNARKARWPPGRNVVP